MGSSEWEKTTWGELATLEYGKSLRDYQGTTGDIPVYGTNGRIGYTDKPLCTFPSVIIGRKGAYRGVHYSNKPYFVIDTAFYLKPKSPKIDLKFAYYQLLTQDINSLDSGSAIPSTSREDFYNLEIILPPIETQRRIASILSTLDDKIELNRQTNQTLEAIAQAIYKEWFVNFRFPHSPLEGWQAKPDGVDSSLRPCPKAVNSSQTTPTSPASWQKNSLFPFWTLPKNRTLQERAKELRKQGILSEVIFWKTFKDKKRIGWDIDRQVIIGNFIVDFFIPELGLVFEIDGSSHNDKQEYDRERDAFLSSLQLKVVRISGKDVLGNLEGVWSFVTKSIKERVEELSPPRPSGTPQEGNSPPRQASPATPQEGKKYEMQDSELGPIPKGWRVVTFEDELEAERGLSYKGKGLATSGAVPMHNLNSVYEGGGYKFEGIKYYSGGHMEKHIVRPGDLIIANTEQGHKYLLIGYPAIVPYVFGDVGIYSHHIYRLRPSPHSYLTSDFLYQLLLRPEIREQVVGFANGTTVNMLKIEGLQRPKFVLPPRYLVSKFSELAASIRLRQEENIKQSTTLSAIRDALLPKLMSGEIEV
ncbi:MAG: DUF559 domain-containing protein [Candidatus Kuenenia sp.]|nr:DUF559 domain-containing protein [Candidatus Kuenenia hertensis]